MLVQKIHNFEKWTTLNTITHPIFYLIICKDRGDRQYRPMIKVGSSSRGLKRFSDSYFPIITNITTIYEFDTMDEAMDMEDLTRVILRQDKNLTFVPNDRFIIKERPKTIQVAPSFGTIEIVPIVDNAFELFDHWKKMGWY